MASYLGCLFKGCFNSASSTPAATHNAAIRIDPSSPTRSSTFSSSIIALASPKSSYTPPSPEITARDKVSELTNFMSPEKNHHWRCQSQLAVCLPVPSPVSNSAVSPGSDSGYSRPGWGRRASYSMLPRSTSPPTSPDVPDTPDGAQGWNRCQIGCGSDFSDRKHKWERSAMVDKAQREFLCSLLIKMIRVISSASPASSPTHVVGIDVGGVLGVDALSVSQLAMIVRIIFSLSYNTTPWSFSLAVGTLERDQILKAMIDVHWPPLYQIAYSLGVMPDEVCNTLSQEIDRLITSIRSAQADLEKKLQVETLGHLAIDRLKRLKACIVDCLQCYIKMIDVCSTPDSGIASTITTMIASAGVSGGGGGEEYKVDDGRSSKRKSLIKVICNEVEILAECVRELCTLLIDHASRISKPPSGSAITGTHFDWPSDVRERYSMDTWILNGRGGFEISTMDHAAVNVAINIRRISREIHDLFKAFNSRLRSVKI